MIHIHVIINLTNQMNNQGGNLMEIIDLYTDDSKTLWSKYVGAHFRDKYELDEKDKLTSVLIRIPDDTVAITTPFFEGMFQPSIQKLGKDKFKQVYKFKSNESVLEGIHAIMDTIKGGH